MARVKVWAAAVVAAWACSGRAADAPGAFLADPTIKDLTPPLFPASAACEPPHAGGHHEDADGGLFGRAEYLLLRPRRSAFDYAIVDPSRDLVPAGSMKSLNYELRSGVRVGLGYRLPAGWDVLAGYTNLRSGADGTAAPPAGGLIYPTLTRPGLTDSVTGAVAKASLEYNAFDIEVGRRWEIDERLSGRMFAGVRFLNVRQNFDATYIGGDATNAKVMQQADFNGFGPIAGGEGSLKVYNNFHIYARGAAGLLTGKVDYPTSETNNGGLTTYANLDATGRKVVPTMALGIGGGWATKRVSVRIGYEITHYFGLSDQIRLTNDFAEGKTATRALDLSLEGIFVQFGLAY